MNSTHPVSLSSIQPVPKEALRELPQKKAGELDKLDTRIATTSQAILTQETYVELGRTRLVSAVSFLQAGFSTIRAMTSAVIIHSLEIFKREKTIRLFGQEVDKFIQELIRIAPELTACIAKLEELKQSAKQVFFPYNLSNKLMAILQKHIEKGCFEPYSPLTWAVSKKSLLFVAWLLEHGAQADQVDKTNKTPFSYSFLHLNLAIAELLVQHGALGQYRALRPNIFLVTQNDTSPSFRATIQSTLEALEKTPVGLRLLEKIGKGIHPIFITNSNLRTYCHTNEGQDSTIRGKGSSTLIFYSELDVSYVSTDCTSVPQPNFARLGHELIHACHNSYGKSAINHIRCDKMVWTSDEEYKTIMGFPSKNPARKIPKITENAILAGIGLPERICHTNGEVLKVHDEFSLRIQATAKLYKLFCEKAHYEGQAQNPPPPMVHVAQEYFGASKKIELFYHIALKGRSESTISVRTKDILPDSVKYFWVNFAPHHCPEKLELKNVCPTLADAKVLGAGIYRLSELEAEAAETC